MPIVCVYAELRHQNSQAMAEFSYTFACRMKFALVAGIVAVGFGSLAPARARAADHPAPALYPTKAAAEEAAKTYHCTGAHPMGDQWMPCASHTELKSPQPMGATSKH